jgi:hypothetical protein
VRAGRLGYGATVAGAPDLPAGPGGPEVPFVLAVGIYDTAQDALTDLRDLTNPGPIVEVLAGCTVLARTAAGARRQQPGGGTLAFSVGTGLAAGVALGGVLALALGPATLVAAAGAGAGAALGRRLAQRETAGLLALLAVDLPVAATALVCVVPEPAAGELRTAMRRSRRTTGRLLQDPESRAVARGLVRGHPGATQWLGEP